MKAIARRFFWFLLALPSIGWAHQLDEYIQATVVAIEPGEIRLEMNLTTGVEVASQVLALIDRDQNSVVSTNEATAYAEALQRDLTVRLDKHKVKLKLSGFSFPAVKEMREGVGIIQIEFSIATASLAAGPHKLTIENRHVPAVSAYLINAARPKSALIQITAQKRNETQSLGEVDFNFSAPAKAGVTKKSAI